MWYCIHILLIGKFPSFNLALDELIYVILDLIAEICATIMAYISAFWVILALFDLAKIFIASNFLYCYF